MNLKSLVVHAYRGIPEVHSWSHYTKHNHHWSVCGYVAEGSVGIPALEDTAPDVGIRGTTEVAKVTCAFCLDLIENTQKRQALIPSGRDTVAITDPCFRET